MTLDKLIAAGLYSLETSKAHCLSTKIEDSDAR